MDDRGLADTLVAKEQDSNLALDLLAHHARLLHVSGVGALPCGQSITWALLSHRLLRLQLLVGLLGGFDHLIFNLKFNYKLICATALYWSN